MTNIWRKYLITFTFNVYFGSLWHDRNRSQRLEKIEQSILTSSFSQDFISVASSDDLFQIVNIRHLMIENHLIYSCFMMQHRINCPRTASESISVDILHADSSNKVCAGLFCILVAFFNRSLRQDSQSDSDLLLSPPKLENMKLKQLTHFCKFVTLKRDLHGPLADARWRSCSFQTLHSRYQMLVWKLVCNSEVVRTNSHLASSLYLFRSWNFELLTDFNNSQRLRRMDSGTCKMRAETAELRKNLYKKIYKIWIHFFNKYTWWQHSLY